MFEAKDMTLRDWFAGKAMQVLLGSNQAFLNRVIDSDKNAGTFACYALLAYEMAEAMIQEKEALEEDIANV